MYHPEIIERRLHKVKKAGILVKRLPRDKSIEITANLDKLKYRGDGQLLPEGQLARELDAKEHDFIRSERILCKADFEYFLTRYYTVERDPGVGTESGNGPAKLLESQQRFIHAMGDREKVCYAELAKYGHTAGILIYAHKCRQVAFTSTARGATLHRMLFYPGIRCFAATLKDGPQGTGELYKRDLLALNNLPWWLKPSDDLIYPNVKDEEIGLAAPFDCRLSYQAENQQTGIGTGTQQDVSHLTEVPLWSYPHRIRYSFYPSLPKAVSTLHIQEGTSAGKGGYWQEVSEGCRRKEEGFEDWTYIFVPWYINTLKYRGNPPDSWSPNKHTVEHAELIARTSPEFNDGKAYWPSRDQLFWWEKTRAMHMQNGELASFLANYPATPEQSFTNWAQGALPVELIERYEMENRIPVVYEVHTDSTDVSGAVTPTVTGSAPAGFPTSLYIGGRLAISHYTSETWDEIERDPRGLLLMWHAPKHGAKYIMGLDPTQGITGWNRGNRVKGDHKTDNGAILIFQVDGVVEPIYKEIQNPSGPGTVQVPVLDEKTKRPVLLYRDLQVAEYAAPCDAVEIARITNILGRVFCGDEEEQCELIWEAWPGPGILTTQELIRLGYGNLWMWEYITSAAEETNMMGWRSSRESQKLLWYRSRRHLMGRQAVIRSKFLLSEYANAEIDVDKMRARASYGYHDDRFQAANMCFWGGHKWTYDVETTEEKVSETAIMDYQRYAPSLDDYESYSDWRANATADWD